MALNHFVDKFYNIDGATLNEKKKNFGILIQDIPEDHSSLLSSLTPRNHLQKIFKFKILLKLQKKMELLDILTTDDEDMQHKLLKNKWWCQNIALILDENSLGFVNGVLPFTSYIIRKRIIRVLATYGRNLDQIYDDLCTRYGIHVALDLLVGCSDKKIEHILKANPNLTLTAFHQKILFNKHPQLFLLYCKTNNRHKIDDSVTRHIARKDINYFLKLVEEKKYLLGSLGKHLTRNLVKNSKDLVLTNSGYLNFHLHIKSVVKRLKHDDLNQFGLNCSPQTLKDFMSSTTVTFSNFRHALGKRYYNFLKYLFETKYNKSIYDYSKLISDKMLHTMDVKEREKWVLIKRNEGTPENSLIPFLDAADSIPLIKKKINVTSSISDRGELLQLLVFTVKVNNMQCLKEVCHYITRRHRNENLEVLGMVLSAIQHFFDLDKLQAEHWQSINSILQIYSNRSPTARIVFDFYETEIRFMFHDGHLTDEKLCRYLKLSKQLGRWCNTAADKKFQKHILLKRVELLPVLLGSRDVPEYYDLAVIRDIFHWNKENPKDQVSVFPHPRLMESLKQCVQKALEIDDYVSELQALTPVLQHFICDKTRSEFREQLINAYFSLGLRYYNLCVDYWLLRNQPEIILANFDKFLEHLFAGYPPNLQIITYIRKYTDAGFCERIVKYALQLIGKKEHPEAAFTVLAVLEETNNFVRHIAPFYPESGKYESIKDPQLADMTIAIPRSLKYATGVAVFPPLFRFCKGDFLRYSLESLYYRVYHTPEQLLSLQLSELWLKAVSVRKHSIFLTCVVGREAEVKETLNYFIELEKNVSVRKHLFTACLKYFTKNPSDELWSKLKSCMTKLDKNDKESFNMLLNIRQIPESHQFQYVMFVWDILKQTEGREKEQVELIAKIPTRIFKDFPIKFLMEVIDKSFLKLFSESDNVINEFVCKCLSVSPLKYEVVGKISEIAKRLSAPVSNLRIQKQSHHLIRDFINTLISALGTCKQNLRILAYLWDRWQFIFPTDQFIRIHVKMTLTLIYLRNQQDFPQFTSTVVTYFDTLVDAYGHTFIDCFASELKEALQIFLKCCDSDESYLQFCLNLCQAWPNVKVYLLVLKMLPTVEPTDDVSLKTFSGIIQVLGQVPDKSIQVLVNVFLMDLE